MSFSQFRSAVTTWHRNVRNLTIGVARGMSVDIYHNIVRISPQFSGDYTANWRYSVGSIDKRFEPVVHFGSQRDSSGHLPRFLSVPKYAGHEAAIEVAYHRNKGNESRFRELGQTIFISNSAVHDEAYAFLIEEGKIKFRPGTGNAPGVVRRALAMTIGEYGTIIGKNEAMRLTGMTLGGYV